MTDAFSNDEIFSMSFSCVRFFSDVLRLPVRDMLAASSCNALYGELAFRHVVELA
jgi:hypothetical protein